MKILIKNLQKKVAIAPALIRKTAEAVLAARGLNKAGGELGLCFVADPFIKRLNSMYHSSDRSTDVLTFDIRRTSREPFMADIVISADTAKRNAREFGSSLEYELCLYAAHGILHLSGLDDRTARQRRIMERETENILKKINIVACLPAGSRTNRFSTRMYKKPGARSKNNS